MVWIELRRREEGDRFAGEDAAMDTKLEHAKEVGPHVLSEAPYQY